MNNKRKVFGITSIVIRRGMLQKVGFEISEFFVSKGRFQKATEIIRPTWSFL